MNLTNARTWIRQFARNSGDSSMYEDADVDRALMTVGQDFCLVTRALVAMGVFNLSLDDASAAVTGSSMNLVSGTPLAPENLIDVTVADALQGCDPHLRIIDYPEFVLVTQREGADLSGRPRIGAVPANNADGFSLSFFPNQDSTTRSLFVRCWAPFPVWTPGVDPATVTSLALPDHWLMPILTKGAPAILQGNEPEHEYAVAAWAAYEKFRDSRRGSGSLGVRSASRSMQE